MEKEIKTKKGITLIVLVITIIILIILAGITINLVIGEDGILRRAEEVGKNYMDAAENEEIQLNEFFNETYKIIANVTGENESSGGNCEETQVLVTGVSLNKTSAEIVVGSTETLTVTIAPENAINKVVKWTTSDANVATVANGVVTAVSEGNATITAEATDGSGKSASCEITTKVTLASLKAGDYLKYDSGENHLITCRVLYPASSPYGLQIISDKNVKNVKLGTENTWEAGKIAYNNAIVDLNNFAEEYINEDYAKDARCVGSLPTVDADGNFIDKDKGTTTTVTLPVNTWDASSYTRPIGWITDETGCYKLDKNYVTDQTQMQEAQIWATGEIYWTASRGGHLDSSCYLFGVRFVYEDGGLGGNDLCLVYSDGSTRGDSGERGLRPCISLKSDSIKIVSGDGKSADTAYKIGI